MNTQITHIEYYLPGNILTNKQLSEEYPDWSVDKIFKKTGIQERRIAGDSETATDLAYEAASLLFENSPDMRAKIDYIILCTQSPDYKLPTSACLLQERLGINNDCGAIDINQGCSGFVYSLGVAHSLIFSEQASNVLLLTAETYSKYINSADKSVRTLFGDAAAAVVVSKSKSTSNMHSFTYSTDGKGADKLIVPHGGSRHSITNQSVELYTDKSGNQRNYSNLYMDGGDVFTFTLKAVKDLIKKTLVKSELKFDDIDHFVLHQPNKFMLNQLQIVCNIPTEKLHRNYEFIGNTVSSTVPILLKDILEQGKLKAGDRVLICGFGVGYSASAAIIEW
ncbi:3-oxoacyl-ACP synthase III family protein [Shewanella sp. 0m-8]